MSDIIHEARGGVVDGLAGRPKHAAITPGHYVHDAECEAMSGAACIDGPGCGFQADPPGCSVGPFDDKPMIADSTVVDCHLHTVTDSRFTGADVKPLDPTKPMTVTNADVIAAGRYPIPSALAPVQWPAFVEAARSLKQAEQAYLAAQQAYAEAVKRLSEEAVR